MWKRKMFCKDQALPTSLHFKEINDNDEIDIMMDGITSEECDGYKCYNFDDANSEGNLKNNLWFYEWRKEWGRKWWTIGGTKWRRKWHKELLHPIKR